MICGATHTITPKGAVVLVCHNATFPIVPACPRGPEGETTKMVIHRQEVECSAGLLVIVSVDFILFFIVLRRSKHSESLAVLYLKTALINQS